LAKPEWGTKRICPNCGARYYDLRKDPPICPSCGAVYDPEALLKSRRARSAPVDDTKKVVVVADDPDLEADEVAEIEGADDEAAVAELEDEADDEPDDEDDVLLEDASELGEDDDVGEVVAVEDSEEDDGRR